MLVIVVRINPCVSKSSSLIIIPSVIMENKAIPQHTIIDPSLIKISLLVKKFHMFI